MQVLRRHGYQSAVLREWKRVLVSAFGQSYVDSMLVGVIPAAISLAAFAWLLSPHPGAAGRTYAAYGGVYVSVALMWLWLVDGQRPDRWDVIGVAVTVIGMSIIAFTPRVK